MKKTALIAMLIGLAALSLIVAHQGFESVAALLARGAWLLPLLLVLHALPLLPDALGWRALIRGTTRLKALYWIATVRQAVNRLLPVASVGGEMVGIRLLIREGIGQAEAIASVVIEVAVTLMAEYLFVILGVLCLLSRTAALPFVKGIVAGLIATLPAIALLSWLLRHGTLFSLLQRAADTLFRQSVPDARATAAASIDAAIRDLSRAYPRQVHALLWQFSGMLVGCLETWCALRWFAPGIPFQDAVVLEALSQAARHVIFIVPAGLGIQEFSFLSVGSLLGVGGDVALAVSLAKRAGEIVFGVAALASWQWAEGRLLLRSRKPRPATGK